MIAFIEGTTVNGYGGVSVILDVPNISRQTVPRTWPKPLRVRTMLNSSALLMRELRPKPRPVGGGSLFTASRNPT